MSAIAVVDCGMGNLHSVLSGLRRALPRADVVIAESGAQIDAAEKVIFPGDGHFDACMREIDRRGLRKPLLRAAAEKPFFGICVGMQVLFAGSEEGARAGLGVFPATIKRLPAGGGRKVPHMGWNQTRHRRRHAVTGETPDNTRFYFIHSYYAPVGDWTLMTADYGVEVSAVIGGGQNGGQNSALLGAQFHPEKSGARGIRLLEKFART